MHDGSSWHVELFGLGSLFNSKLDGLWQGWLAGSYGIGSVLWTCLNFEVHYVAILTLNLCIVLAWFHRFITGLGLHCSLVHCSITWWQLGEFGHGFYNNKVGF